MNSRTGLLIITDKVRNETIKEKINLLKDRMDTVEEKHLIWYGNLNKMDTNKIPIKPGDESH